MALTINDLSKKLLKDRDIEILKEIKMLDWINELSSINRLMFSVLEKLCTHDFYRYSLVEALQLSITVLGKSCLPKKEQFAIDEWIRLAGKVDENFRTSMWHSIEGFDPDRNYIDSLQVLVKHGMVQIFEIGEYLPINDDDVKFVFDQLEKGRMSRTLQLQINPAMPSLYH